MTADIYVQQNIQDPTTGSISRQWVYSKTIQCKIEPIKVGGASTRGDNRIFDKTAEGTYTETVSYTHLTLPTILRV